MDKIIEKELEKQNFKSDDDLQKTVDSILKLINEYESDLYDKDVYTKDAQKAVSEWRRKLYKMTQEKDKLVQDSIPDILQTTVNIVNRQISKVDANAALLKEGTLKLMGLDYTHTDIKSALADTRKKILRDKQAENREIRIVYWSFIIFCISCLIILLDKFIFKL